MDEKDAATRNSALPLAVEIPVPLSLLDFTALCERTTKFDITTGTGKDELSIRDLELLLRHGKAGGVISMEMTSAMTAALFADAQCGVARRFLKGHLDFPSRDARRIKSEHFAKVQAAVGHIKGYCSADVALWAKRGYSEVPSRKKQRGSAR